MLPHVLIVDDEESIRLLALAVLRDTCRVTTAATGTDALQLIRNCESDPYAVVLADLWLSDMTGTDLLVEVERLSPDTTRLMLSGDPRPETAADAMDRAQLFDFIRKPYTSHQIRSAVAEAVRYHQLRIQACVEP